MDDNHQLQRMNATATSATVSRGEEREGRKEALRLMSYLTLWRFGLTGYWSADRSSYFPGAVLFLLAAHTNAATLSPQSSHSLISNQPSPLKPELKPNARRLDVRWQEMIRMHSSLKTISKVTEAAPRLEFEIFSKASAALLQNAAKREPQWQ